MDNKGNKQWVWLAIDVKTREIVGVYIGDRSEEGAKGLWASQASRCIGSARCAIAISGLPMVQCYPASGIDQWGRKAVKPTTHTRFNCTLRQRISRLVRKTLSFSKKLDNSLWSHLVLYSSLQCILTCLGLPWCENFFGVGGQAAASGDNKFALICYAPIPDWINQN